MYFGKFKQAAGVMEHGCRYFGAEEKGTGKSKNQEPSNVLGMPSAGVPFHAPVRYHFDADGAGKPERKKGTIQK